MNIPSKIRVKLPSIILESNSSNNAIWGQIFGDIANQADLNALLQDETQRLFELDYVTLANPVSGSSETVNLSDLQLNDRTPQAGDLVYGMARSGADGLDYYIFAAISTVSSSTTADIDIKYSIKQIDYVYDPNYVHTDNNYTSTEKAKLNGVEAGAQVNVKSDWNASTGDAQILNKPSIGNAKISLSKNGTEFGSFEVNQTTDKAIGFQVSKSDVGLSNVDNTRDVDKPVSNATQYQLDGINNSLNDITKVIPVGTTETNQLVNQSQVNGQIGNARTRFKLNGTEIGNITANQFTNSEIDYVVNKSDVGLSNVDNTSDANKPISTAVQTELNTIKQDITDLGNDKANKSETYTKTQIDANYQNLAQKDAAIPVTPSAGNYPTTGAVKSYVDTSIADALGSNIFRGIFNFASNEGLVDGDPAPANAVEGDTVIDITNNNTFIVDASLLLEIQPPIATGNGYYYDIQHFTFNHDQSGMIKWNTDTDEWNYIVSNNSGVDDITIEINAQNNYQLKDGGITATKIDATFLGEIQNLGVDWNQTNPDAGDYIRNKPVNATQTAAGLMSATDKAKLDGVADGAEVNVQSDWNVTDATNDAYIQNKPVNATDTVNGFMSAADKAKLDGVEAGAQVNVQSNWNATTGTSQILNKPGNASQYVAGLMSAADKTKLDGVEAGAKANVQSDWDETDTGEDSYILNKPANATQQTSGLMSYADNIKLDNIETGGDLIRINNNFQTDKYLAVEIDNYKFWVDQNPTYPTMGKFHMAVLNGTEERCFFKWKTWYGTDGIQIIGRYRSYQYILDNTVLEADIYNRIGLGLGTETYIYFYSWTSGLSYEIVVYGYPLNPNTGVVDQLDVCLIKLVKLT
jgi:hypothetical protein